MPLFAHPNALPPQVRTRLVLTHGDRIIASGEITGGWAVASRLALFVAKAGEAILRRPWSDVDRASLDGETQTITVVWVDGGTLDLPLVDHKHPAFARTLRERVQSSVVHGETVKLPGGRLVRVALRRGEDGLLFSQVIGAGNVDLSDPAIATLVEAAEARVRGAAGLPL